MSTSAEEIIEKVVSGTPINQVVRKVLVEGQLPPRGQIMALVKAFALKKYSQQGARIQIQQRYHDKFTTLLNRMEDKYPRVDLTSQSFFADLEHQADKWWKSRIKGGPGVDW